MSLPPMLHRTGLSSIVTLALLSASFAACGGGTYTIPKTPIPVPPAPAETAAPTPTAAAPAALHGIDESALDRSVDVCEDFYQFACGGWMKATPIPDDRSSWSRSFHEIDERNQKKLREILDGYAAGKNTADPYAQKLADYWTTCMDEDGLEKAGLGPLSEAFATIDSLKDGKDLSRVVTALYGMGLHPLFSFSSGQDFGDATQVIGQLEQAGLGLPDRDYYLDKGKKADDIRAAYLDHVSKMLGLAKLDPAGAKAVMALETELAKASMTRVDRRDPKKIYHRMQLAGLVKLSPAFGFDAFVTGLGVDKDAPINVAQPEFAKKLGDLTKKSAADLKLYLKWRAVSERAGSLPKAFVDENFRFSSQNLTGAKSILPRWKRCLSSVDGALGEALAIRFVKDTFGAEGKAKASTMIAEIEEAMEKDLEGLSWMDDATRKKAQDKLHKIKNKIGYPDLWRKYDTLDVVKGQHVKNVLAAEVFELKRVLAKIGKPLDRGEWYMTPPSVNAYYDANMNEMVFPAGILQPPFFDNKAIDALNYGAIGMVMGHELTHGFDDEGRQFDGDGNLKEWWTAKVSKEFDARAACVVKQYDGFVALPADKTSDPKATDIHVNGKLTLGENIADLGGLKLAYAAFKASRKGTPQTAGTFTEDQQFFLSHAQGWCQNARPQYRAMLTKVDPHSPPAFRVNGPASNLPEFASAFSCKPESKMVKKDRCEVW